jgi:hypothetical protein
MFISLLDIVGLVLSGSWLDTVNNSLASLDFLFSRRGYLVFLVRFVSAVEGKAGSLLIVLVIIFANFSCGANWGFCGIRLAIIVATEKSFSAKYMLSAYICCRLRLITVGFNI